MKRLNLHKLFAFIFREMSEEERDAARVLIAEDDVYALQVTELMQYCRAREIYSSVEMNKHLDGLRNQFFQAQIRDGVELPKFLVEAYNQDSSPPTQKAEKIIEKTTSTSEDKTSFNYGKWIVIGILGIVLFSIIWKKCFSVEISSQESLTPLTFDSIKFNIGDTVFLIDSFNNKNIKTLNDINGEINITNNPSLTPLPHSSGAGHDSSEIEIKLSPSPTIDTIKKIKEPRAQNKIINDENFHLAYLEDHPNMEDEILNYSKANLVEKGDEITIDSLLKKVESGKNINDNDNLRIGIHYLELKEYVSAISFLEKIKWYSKADWYLFHCYFMEHSPDSVKKLKKLYKEKISSSDAPEYIILERRKLSDRIVEWLNR